MTRILIFLSLLLLSCSDESLSPNELLLQTIEYTSQNTNASRTETFIYNEASLVSEVQESQNGYIYEISYDGSSPVSISQYSDGELFQQDKIIYSETGNIVKIELSTPNDSGDLEAKWIYDYLYDDNDQVIQRTSKFVTTGEDVSLEKYFWSGGVVTKQEVYEQPDVLAHEYSYKYDNKKNYKKGIPTYLIDPLNWSDHNVTKSEATDYTGLLDLICYECNNDYKYNSDDYPTEIVLGWGTTLTLTYE